jgi:hypothetical protein
VWVKLSHYLASLCQNSQVFLQLFSISLVIKRLIFNEQICGHNYVKKWLIAGILEEKKSVVNYLL